MKVDSSITGEEKDKYKDIKRENKKSEPTSIPLMPQSFQVNKIYQLS